MPVAFRAEQVYVANNPVCSAEMETACSAGFEELNLAKYATEGNQLTIGKVSKKGKKR